VVDITRTHEPQAGYLPALRAIRTLIAEYRRAVAAEERYANLMHMSRTARAHEGITHGGIPRRIFETFYASRAQRIGDPAPRHTKKPTQV
jgi:hypothetical protein